MQQGKDREAKTAQRLKWGSQIVEGIKGEGWANITSAPLGSTEEIVWGFFYFELLTLDRVDGKKTHYHLKAHARTKQSDNTSWFFPVSKVRRVHL